MDPSLGMRTNFWLVILNVPQIGGLERVLVGHCDGEVIGQSYGVLVGGGQQKDISRSTRRVWGQVMCGLGGLVGLVDGRLLRGVVTKVVGSFLPRRPH